MIIIKRTSSDSQRGPPRRRQGEQLGHRARHDLLRCRLGEGGDLSVQLVGQHGGLGHYGGEGRGGPLDPSLRRGVTPSQMGRDVGLALRRLLRPRRRGGGVKKKKKNAAYFFSGLPQPAPGDLP